MNEGFEVGRIAGIRIAIHWSWLVVFVLITWTLADSVFPDANPGLSNGAYIAMALAAAVLFFTSLLLHELGHALQARREGVEIDGISLWLFGGVARFRGMFPSAGAEFRIAIAGPLVSLVIGVGFVLVAWALPLPRGVDAVAAWLGFINLILLAFNLIPALPLDGGRVLRSALWAKSGDLASATRTAGVVARGFAYLMIAGGLAELVFLRSYGGIWLAFLGWFLLQAAGGEERAIATRQALGGLRVGDIMVRNPATVREDMSLGRFMDDVVWSRHFTTYPVVENGRAIGLLPFRCVAEIPRSEWDERSVRDCMLRLDQVPVVTAEDRLVDVLDRLGTSDLRRALVLDDGRLVGLLSITDLARAMEVGRARSRG
ncbi:MAG TPA: site-2 protease family protein [Gaiellaceae bacterium]|nr:site-2 protease family protein [Gaiellaceae bacterium]